MTEEDVKNWKIERDIARESGKPELLQKAYDHRDDLMMHCIQRQADRVKQLVANDAKTDVEVKDIKRDVSDIRTKVTQHESVVKMVKTSRSQAKGFWLALKVLGWISAVFGSGAIGWILHAVNKVQGINAAQ